jgi:copper chaperone CopZ|tara:strand:+ start:539 stop:1249 length:711 start_codon:yes stop_codon:yes gene_type:complete
MATAAITAEIKDITGVTTADVDFIPSAQKFVVANVPNNLLMFAQTQSSTFTGGGGVSVNVDTITEVQRNGYSCRQISISDSKWAADSTSLKKATTTHPVWWNDNGVIKILPEPAGSEDGYYYFIDYTKIDDDSDLRNVVVNYACFKEFAKLMMEDARQGDFSDSSSNMGTEHWIRTEEDSEMLMARIQTIQAQLGERTHFGQMSQQHYNLALAEIKSYIENNPKTLATAMAMQGAR